MFKLRRSILSAFVVALMLFVPGAVLADSYSGAVVHVVDGDTVDVAFRDSPTVSGKRRVRLVGIDTMESQDNSKLRVDEKYIGVNRQSLLRWGQTAKRRLEELVGGKDVVVTFPGSDRSDRYGRLLGRLHVNGHDVNLTLVSEGLAMVYRKASFQDKSAYYETERTAIQQRNGFWGDPAFGKVSDKFSSRR